MLSLKKSDRLRKNKSFQAVYKGGKSVSNRLLVLYMLPNQTSGNKVGFAAGKRLGNAVVRNRVKRMMREAFRLNQDRMPQGYDFIIVGRQPVIGVKTQEVASALLNLSGRVLRTNTERQ